MRIRSGADLERGAFVEHPISGAIAPFETRLVVSTAMQSKTLPQLTAQEKEVR